MLALRGGNFPALCLVVAVVVRRPRAAAIVRRTVGVLLRGLLVCLGGLDEDGLVVHLGMILAEGVDVLEPAVRCRCHEYLVVYLEKILSVLQYIFSPKCVVILTP